MTTPATSIDDVAQSLAGRGYVSDDNIATAVYLSMHLRRPLLVEGHAGVGKTEIAKVLAAILDTELIRLQCYEGLEANAALYEWNYTKQILQIRRDENSGSDNPSETPIFDEAFLLERPLLRALRRPTPPVLLIDEIDRADEEFEAFLLEVLAEYQVTIPEFGTVRAAEPPFVVLTSNRVRELGEALRRRCLYLWIDYPTLEKELRIVRQHLPAIDESLARQVCQVVEALRDAELDKRPGIAETLDWSAALAALHVDQLGPEIAAATIGCVAKTRRDTNVVKQALPELLDQTQGGE